MINFDLTTPITLPRRKFSRRETIPLNDSYLWQIESGYVRALTTDEEGTMATLGFWRPGDVMGQFLSWLDPFQVECLTPVEVSLLPSDSLLCQAALASHSHQVQALLAITHHRRVESRLIHFLNWFAKEFGYPTAQGRLIDLRLTHQDIADAIGTTRVTVTRSLNQFEQDGRVTWLQQKRVLRRNFKKRSDPLLEIPA